MRSNRSSTVGGDCAPSARGVSAARAANVEALHPRCSQRLRARSRRGDPGRASAEPRPSRPGACSERPSRTSSRSHATNSLTTWSFDGARRDEDEVRSPREHRFAAKRRDQQTVAEMAGIVRVASDRDAAAVDRRLHDLVVMREAQRAGRLQVTEVHRVEPRSPVRPWPAHRDGLQIQQHVMHEIRGGF